VAAAFFAGTATLDEMRGLQLVEQPDQVGPLDTQRFGERRLTRFAQHVQHRQRNHVARAQIEVRQLRLHLGADAPGDELQQRTEQAPEAGGAQAEVHP
jgi:hypothetical protein